GLRDPELNRTVSEALTSNLDLRAAWQRLVAARAVARREGAPLLPTLDATGEARIRSAPVLGTGEPQEVTTRSSYRLGLDAGYEVDLWGRIGASADAARLRARATGTDAQAAALSLSGEVTRTWLRLAEARAQISLLDGQIASNETVLQLLENRFGLGQVRAVDLLRQRQLIEAGREQRAVAEARRRILEHQLDVLLGRSPVDDGIGADSLPALPALPRTGVPMELVRRRPDVRAAFLRLQAADRDLAVAITSRFPRLSLSAGVGSEADVVDGLLRNWVTSVAGSLLAPLFRGGELDAEVDRTEAVRQEQLLTWGQATLTAFREVEDALAAELREEERIARIQEQVTLASQASEQLRTAFFNGAASYLEVLTALVEVQELERELLAARLARLEARVDLYGALAGPIDTLPQDGS
ncbi:MAG TPA: efflux transporter outer membrane subunit, partial [Myxococcota bacterium]|nr:efflux transporter outer membrane subunit [Myxococcota bacterium]